MPGINSRQRKPRTPLLHKCPCHYWPSPNISQAAIQQTQPTLRRVSPLDAVLAVGGAPGVGELARLAGQAGGRLGLQRATSRHGRQAGWHMGSGQQADELLKGRAHWLAHHSMLAPWG